MFGEIKLRSHTNRSTTAVCNEFIDQYMTNANGEFVKIYIYLLRCLNTDMANLSISSIADHFDNTEKDVRRALEYWEKMNLLHLDYDSNGRLTSIEVLDLSKNSQQFADIPVNSNITPIKKCRSLSELNAEETQNLRELLFVTESYLGKTLSPMESQKIIYFMDVLNFSPVLIEHLVEHCVSLGYKNLSSIEKIALNWHSEGITSVAEALEHETTHSDLYNCVVKAFGIQGRSLNHSELSYLDKWSKTYKFNKDIIEEACFRTIEFAHQASFRYADSILEKWHELGVNSLQDINSIDLAHKENTDVSKKLQFKQVASNDNNKFNNFKQRSYDYDNLEKQLLGNANVQ